MIYYIDVIIWHNIRYAQGGSVSPHPPYSRGAGSGGREARRPGKRRACNSESAAGWTDRLGLRTLAA